MYVEACTKAILSKILPLVDSKKEGLTIDIGLGTHDFYCQLFDSLKFKTVAIEPLPTDEVYQLCKNLNIPLIESCIADRDGTVEMYIGNRDDNEDYNLNSMRANWWGSSKRTVQVSCLSLQTLLTKINAKSITCLKIDVEGMEWMIIKQLQDLQADLLPKVLMFEYGGGGTPSDRQGGWSPEILEETRKCLELIKNLGYRQVISLDLATELKEQVLDLATSSLETTAIFPLQSIYGNMIALRNFQYPERKIAAICKPYYSYQQSRGIFQRLLSKVF